MKKLLLVAPLLFLAPLLSVAQQTEKVDLSTIHRIKEEALGRNSKVMDHVFYLTDVNGPRLNNSKGYRAAGDWAVKRLKEYGLANVHLEKWGPFGKAWSNIRDTCWSRCISRLSPCRWRGRRGRRAW